MLPFVLKVQFTNLMYYIFCQLQKTVLHSHLKSQFIHSPSAENGEKKWCKQFQPISMLLQEAWK